MLSKNVLMRAPLVKNRDFEKKGVNEIPNRVLTSLCGGKSHAYCEDDYPHLHLEKSVID